MPASALALSGLASLLAGWILMLVLPGSRPYAWGILGLGTALLATAFALGFKRVQSALASGRGRAGIGATLMVSLFVGIVLLVNAISVGRYQRLDFTGLAQFTLTSQTRQVLAELKKPVEVVTLFAPAVPATVASYARSLLAEYKVHSDLLILKDIDPDLQPDQAAKYGLDRTGAVLGAVVFRSEGGQRQVYGPQIAAEAEHAFTSALLEVTGTRQKKVRFLSGHGEKSIQEEYKGIREGLRDNLFQVEDIDLAATPGVPEDTAVLVVAGPRRPLSPAEAALIEGYLESDGRLFLLLDPDPPASFRQLLSRWWMDIEDGVIIDPTSYVAPRNDNPLVPRTRNSLQLGETFFSGATAVIPREARPSDAEVTALVWTSRDARLEIETPGGVVATRKGPLAIGALLDAKGTRLAVIGDSDFASNRNFRNGANADLFLTCVNWLAAGEQIISIDRKVLVTRRLLLNPEQARFVQLSSIGLLPLLLLMAGGWVWWRRSRR